MNTILVIIDNQTWCRKWKVYHTGKSLTFQLIGTEACSDFNLFLLAGKNTDTWMATSLGCGE